MAEKGFGVKEINLIGASGTPTIESPNNLNLNAVNVAISTNVSIGGTLAVTGNVSVGGTLTYEDVTNIDSVGVITARSGVDVDDFISVGSNIHLGNAGVVTATTFSGSAASLTSVPAANITGTLPAISGANLTGITITPSNSDIQVVYTVTANGTSAYRFAGNGVVSTADDPDLYLIRGQKYRFINNSGGSHPFQIREASGGTAYSTGVTNNGAASGNIDFAPTFDSPAQLVYQCTSHSAMMGNIYLKDGNGNETNVGVSTFSGDITVSSGNKLLIGTTTEGNATGENLTIADSGNMGLTLRSTSSNYCNIYFSDATSGTAEYEGYISYNHATDSLEFATGHTERLRIDSSGRVGVNQSSFATADTMFSVSETSGHCEIGIISKNDSAVVINLGDTDSYNQGRIKYDNVTNSLQFRTVGADRLRITSDGKLLVGTTSSTSLGSHTGNANVSTFNQSGITLTAYGVTAGFYYDRLNYTNSQYYIVNSSSVGVYLGNGSTSWSANSDERLKINIAELDGTKAYNHVKTARATSFNWNATGHSTDKKIGFIAQEWETNYPEVVSTSTETVDGVENPKGIRYTETVPVLMAALKEAISKIETLEAEVAALKGS